MHISIKYKAMCDLYLSGLSMQKVADVHGVSIGTVHRAVKRFGIKAREKQWSGVWQQSWGYNTRKIKGKLHKEHVLIVESVLGKKLPPNAVVHHVNGVRSDNRHANLVVCRSQQYHMLLHIRTKALQESGNANYRKCQFCKKYDDPKLMLKGGGKTKDSYYHKSCRSIYRSAKNAH